MLKFIPLFLLLIILSCDVNDSAPVNELDPPEIENFTATPPTVAPEDTSLITVEMSFNLVAPSFTYTFSQPDGGTIDLLEGGAISGANTSITTSSSEGEFKVNWIAPDATGSYRVIVTVNEKSTFRETTQDTVTVEVAN